jgi:hypothetical protein
MNKYSNTLLFKTVVLIQLMAFSFIIVNSGYPQDIGVKKLEKGIELYQNLEFDQAIAVLSECIEKEKLTVEQQQRAYKFLVQACISNNYKDRAKNALKELLDKDQSYRPDANIDRTSYINFFNQVLEEWKKEVNEKKRPWQQIEQLEKSSKEKQQNPPVKKKSNFKKWLLIGGGVLIAGTTAILIFSKEKEEKGSITISW